MTSRIVRAAAKTSQDLSGVRRNAGTRVLTRYLISMALHAPEILRKRSLIPADRGMRRGPYRFCPAGPASAIHLDSSTPLFQREDVFSGAREMYCRGVYSACPGFDIHPGDTIFDLGANIGLFSTMAAVAGARVVAIEAQSGFLPCIEENLGQNNVRDRVAVHHGLIAGTRGVLSGGSLFGDHWFSDPTEVTIPELTEEHHVEWIDLMKVDIEGSEFELLTEDAAWLGRVDRIAMEVHPPHGSVAELARVLEGHGFDVRLLDNDGAKTEAVTGPTGFLFARRTPRS